MAARLALACTLQLNLSPSSQAKDDNARVHWPEQQELHPGQSYSEHISRLALLLAINGSTVAGQQPC